MTRSGPRSARHFSKASWDSGANHNTRFYDPKVEDLLVPRAPGDGLKRRAGYYREIQEIVWQVVPIIPLHTIKVVVLTRANVTGLIVQADEALGLASVKRRPWGRTPRLAGC